MPLGRTARYYKNGTTKKGGKKKPAKAAAARKKHNATSKKAAAKPHAKRKRAETNNANRNDPKSRKGDKIDKSHEGKRIVNESQKTNRARGGGKKK